MAESEGPRSVKIGADERTGWSSERPRRRGQADRPANIAVRCKILRPTEEIRYSPGSLLVIASASEADREALAERVVEQKGALLSTAKVRELLAGRVPDEEMDARRDRAAGRRGCQAPGREREHRRRDERARPGGARPASPG